MRLSEFPLQSYDKLRYGDCDPQGHVNNAVFATFLETGRCDMLALAGQIDSRSGTAFVIARLELDFIAEIIWPGRVEIGTAVAKLGNSSIHIEQAVFQEDRLVAKAKSVLVHLDDDRRPASLSDAQRAVFTKLLHPCA